MVDDSSDALWSESIRVIVILKTSADWLMWDENKVWRHWVENKWLTDREREWKWNTEYEKWEICVGEVTKFAWADCVGGELQYFYS